MADSETQARGDRLLVVAAQGLASDYVDALRECNSDKRDAAFSELLGMRSAAFFLLGRDSETVRAIDAALDFALEQGAAGVAS